MKRLWLKLVWLAVFVIALISCLGPTSPGAGDQADSGDDPATIPPSDFRIASLVHELLFDDPASLYTNTATGAPDATDKFANASAAAHADRFGFASGGLTMDAEPLLLPPSERNHPSDDGMTISFWARLSNIQGTAAEAILSTVNSASPQGEGWQLLYRPAGSGDYVFRIGHGSSSADVSLGVPASVVSRWHHVAVVWDRTATPTPTLTVNVNGLYEVTGDLPDDAYTPSALDLAIGINGLSYPFDGELDQLRIYDAPLPLDDSNAELDVRRLRDEGKRIYYASASGGSAAIYASPIDGSDAELIASPPTTTSDAIRDIEVRPDLGYVYWTNINEDTIERAPLGGGPVEIVFDAAASSEYLARTSSPLIRGIAVSADGSAIYVGDQNYDGILGIDLTTGAVTSIYKPVSPGASNLTILDVDLDAANDRLYFLEEETIGVNSYALMTVMTNGSSHGTLIENSEGSGEPQPAGLALDIANNRVFFAGRVGKTYEVLNLSAVTPTITEIGSTGAAFNIGLSYSPSDDALFLPREEPAFGGAGDVQSFVVETGSITNYTGVDAIYALDLLAPRE